MPNFFIFPKSSFSEQHNIYFKAVYLNMKYDIQFIQPHTKLYIVCCILYAYKQSRRVIL